MKKYRSLLRLARGHVRKRMLQALCERVRMLKDGMAGSRDDAVIFQTVSRILGAECAGRLGLQCPHATTETRAPESLHLAAAELVALTEALDFQELGEDKLVRHWKKTVRKMRRTAKNASKSGGAHDFHTWRKRAKDLWYQSAALAGLSDSVASVREPAERLSDILGVEHDLSMVLESLRKLDAGERKTLRAARKRLRIEAAEAEKAFSN